MPRLLLLASLLSCLGLEACSALPASGPTEREVLEAEQDGRNPIGFRIVNVTPAVLVALESERRPVLLTLAPLDVSPAAPAVATGLGDRSHAMPQRGSEGKEEAGVGRSAYVQGDVRTPGRQPLSRDEERVLDVIALRGGTTAPSQDMFVQLTRREQSAQVPLRRVEEDARENIVVRPGDRIRLIRRPRSFTVFGAGGKIGETPLEAADVNLAEAVARAGGPHNDRADPNAVFLFRFESASVASALGILREPAAASARAPIAYHLDLMDPSSYFLAQNFAVRDKDMIYIANARTDRLQKVIAIISSVATPYLDSR